MDVHTRVYNLSRKEVKTIFTLLFCLKKKDVNQSKWDINEYL